MITLLLANMKGGVGKSAVAVQYGHYLHEKRGLRVAFVDLDQQANSTKALRSADGVSVSSTTAAALMAQPGALIDVAPFMLFPADDELAKFESQKLEHNKFATNFRNSIAQMQDHFDVCIVDTNPFPDIRIVSALVAVDYVVSPIQLNQEAIDGIGALRKLIAKFNTAPEGRKPLNAGLKFIGILPNMVTPAPFQRNNFAEIAKHFGQLLIPTGKNAYALIKQSTAVAEAQAACKPVWKLGKTSARETWRDMEPSFVAIANAMEVKNGN